MPDNTTVLEIGCGAGVATEKLVKTKRFKTSQFTASDIYPEMLDVCKRKLGIQVSNYEVVDGENLPASMSYDVIMSSLCFHLFRDVPNTIAELGKHSRYSALAIPLEGSLNERGSLCRRFGLESRLVDFPRSNALAEVIRKSRARFELVEETVRQDFSETRGFLDFLRSIGSTKSRSSAPKQNLKVLPLEDPLSVTYNIEYLFIAWGDTWDNTPL